MSSTTWTERVRARIEHTVPPGEALPDHQPAYVSSWIYVFGVLTLAAFVLFFFIARPHVTWEDPTMVNLFGAFTASCMAGVFWLAWQMFRVVLRGQREDGQQR